MSKVWKGIKKIGKKVVGFVKDHWKEIVIVGAVALTAGAASVGLAGMSAAYGTATASAAAGGLGMGTIKAALYVGGSTMWAGLTSMAGTLGIGSGASGFVATQAGMQGSTLLTGAAAQSLGMATKGGSWVPGAGANTGQYTGWGSGVIGNEGALFGNLGATEPIAPASTTPVSPDQATGQLVQPDKIGGTTVTDPVNAAGPTNPAGVMHPDSGSFLPPGGYTDEGAAAYKAATDSVGWLGAPDNPAWMSPLSPTISIDTPGGIMNPASANFVKPASYWTPEKQSWWNKFLYGDRTNKPGYPGYPYGGGFMNSMVGAGLVNGLMGAGGSYFAAKAMEDQGPIAQWGHNLNGKPASYVLPGTINPATGMVYTDQEIQDINVNSRAGA